MSVYRLRSIESWNARIDGYQGLLHADTDGIDRGGVYLSQREVQIVSMSRRCPVSCFVICSIHNRSLEEPAIVQFALGLVHCAGI